MDTRTYIDNGDGTVTLRGWHHTDERAAQGILEKGFIVNEYRGAHAWGVGVYATHMEGRLRNSFLWNPVELLIEARVPKAGLVVVTEENDQEMVEEYLTWGRNEATAVLVDIPDYSIHVSYDCACQFQVPPDAVRVLAYRRKAKDVDGFGASYKSGAGPLVWL